MYFGRFVCELYLFFSFMMEREKKKAEISEKEKIMQQVGLVGLVEAPARDCQPFLLRSCSTQKCKMKRNSRNKWKNRRYLDVQCSMQQ
jgi:hypothetical protein